MIKLIAPSDVEIRIELFPNRPRTKKGRRLQNQASIAEVRRAIKAWYKTNTR